MNVVSEKGLICLRKHYWISKQTNFSRLAFSLRQHKLHSYLSSTLIYKEIWVLTSSAFFFLRCNCKFVPLSLLWCSLVGSLWAGCSPCVSSLLIRTVEMMGQQCRPGSCFVIFWAAPWGQVVAAVIPIEWVWKQEIPFQLHLQLDCSASCFMGKYLLSVCGFQTR